ncbi:hypothetical protein GCM10022245_77900 [Streptomyces mayteni]
MRGIVGYVGVQSALDVLLAGLGRLERPDHDVSGVAVLADGGLATVWTPGRLGELRAELARRPLPAGGCGIAHGGGRPRLDNAGRVAVVHGGRVENDAELRAELAARGHRLESATGTEVVAHLLAESFSSCGELGEAMRQVCRALRGEFALLAVHADEPDAVVGAHRGRPLAVALGEGESFLAGDAAAFAGEAVRDVVRLDAGDRDQVVLVRREFDEVRYEITDADGGVVLA